MAPASPKDEKRETANDVKEDKKEEVSWVSSSDAWDDAVAAGYR